MVSSATSRPGGRLERPTPRTIPDDHPDLAPASVFLASQESRSITGEVIGVTGGTPLP